MVFHLCLKGMDTYCNLLCLTALVSQGEMGIMGACGHYTVIGYPPYIGVGLLPVPGQSQSGPGLVIPVQKEPALVVASLHVWFQQFPPCKKVGFYLYPFKDEFLLV